MAKIDQLIREFERAMWVSESNERGMSVTVYDKHGYPICKGDLLRSYHFGSGKGTRYLYHVAVEKNGFMWAVPTCHLEPTCVSGGGKCLLSCVGEVEILSGYGPAPILEYRDRPKGKSPQSKGAKEKRKVNYMKTNAEIETLLTEIEGRQQRWFDGTTQERSELSRPLIIEDFPALVKLVRELMQQLDSLRRVGGTMANVMYNVKQRSPLVITEREREIIAALQQEWDLLSRSVPQEDKQCG